jgi:riboflavin kinase/FMN adenylyltransferase
MKRGRIITIGSFDGVHRGHQALLVRAQTEARKRKLKSMALTFRIPPRMVLDHIRVPHLLSDNAEKNILLKNAGMDEVLMLNFSRKISRLRPFNFFRDMLVRTCGAKGVVVGLDFRFGQNRSAGAHELVRWGEEFNIPIWVIAPVKFKSEVVSSSLIRKNFTGGHANKAIKLLGHPHLIRGRVVRGRGVGKKIGFPTANIKTAPGKILPRGVFAVKGEIEGWRGARRQFQGVCNIGVRPTLLKTSAVHVEVHLFHRHDALVGRTINLELVHQIRSEKKFANLRALQDQIRRDITIAKRMLAKNNA